MVEPIEFDRMPTASITLTTSAVGDELTRVQCSTGYSATIYAENLTSPDGLAFSPAGNLYVAEENPGRVGRIGSNGVITPVITGLSNPEGIAFDSSGNLYVVEDIKNGRVVKLAAGGVTSSTVVTGRDAPEGIVWVDDGSANGILYITESNLEYAVEKLTFLWPPSCRLKGRRFLPNH